MNKNLIEKTAEYVKLKLYNEPTGHDWYHVERVWKIAKFLQATEGGNSEIIELSALLHDLGDYQQREFNEIKGSLILRGMMDILGIAPDMQEIIIKVVEESQYQASETKTPTTLEGKIIQDADWLDAIGAIGLSRTFATGGRIKRIIHDPKRKPRRKISKEDYQTKKREGTSINQIYEKIFRLPNMMNTATAKKIAESRIDFVEKFTEQFFLEWKGLDLKNKILI
jgi:uncharacterized protein